MGWVKMKLGDVLKNREGRYKPVDPAIAGLKRIDKINFSGQLFLSDKGSNTDMILIKKGDLVISGINVEKGALAVYEGEEDILATIHYSSYIFDTTKIDIDFLKVFLRSPDFVQLLKEQVPGGIKTEIKPKHILPLEVYFPETTSGQKVIAEHFFEKEAKFNQLDEHISYQLNQIESLNQAILQEAVQGKLVKQDPKDEPASKLLKRIKSEKAKSGKKEKLLPPIQPKEIPFEIPVNWVWCRLSDIANVGTGATPLTSNPEYYKGTIPWITSAATNDLFVNQADSFISEKALKETNCQVYPIGTLIVAMYGQGKTRGQITELNIEAATNQACAAISFIVDEITLRKYIKYFFQQNYLEIRKLAQGGAQPNLNLSKVKDTLIPLPPLSEQLRIVAEIEKQFAKTKQLKEHIISNQQATEQLLKALLHQAFEVEA